MTSGGGTPDVVWETASGTVRMSKVQLVINGDVRQSGSAKSDGDSSYWSVRIDHRSWVALMVQGASIR